MAAAAGYGALAGQGMNFMGQQNAALGGGLGSLGYMLFGNYKNPADAASQYLNQISGTITPYYDPYIQAGRQALPELQGQYNQLMNDPGAMMAKWGQGFHQDPGYQWQVKQATDAANAAAAAGGMLGSPAEQQTLAQTVSGIADQNYQNYMNRAQGLYGMGLQGMGGINQMGYGASTGLANNLANALLSQANLAYAGQANANQTSGGEWGSLGQALAWG